MTSTRFQTLQRLMTQANVSVAVLNPGPTLTYLTGLQFHLMERPTVLVYQIGKDPILILPELEAGKLQSSHIPLVPVPYGDNPSTWQGVFESSLVNLRDPDLNIGVEPTRIRFLELDLLQNALPAARFVSADKVFSNLRIHKDAEEVAHMRRAVQIAQEALQRTLPLIKPGIREAEIAAELTINLFRCGSDPELPFSPIIASGPNSANPHASPTERPLQSGDLVVIDWGARSNGYCSDITRTFAIQEISSELQNIYQAVYKANKAGREAGKPGIAAGDVDQAVRNEIERAGFGRFFTHRTGHGIGLEDHETPYIFSENDLLLDEGMTYTVEPGIYLPGLGGVRIEDDVLVTAAGSESLTDLPRELIIL